MYPTLIVTVGEVAQCIAECTFKQIQSHFREFIPGIAIMHLYRVRKVKFEPPRESDDEVSARQVDADAQGDADNSEQQHPQLERQPMPPPEPVSQEGLLHWLPFPIECAAEKPSPKELRDAFVASLESFEAHLPKLTKALLDASNLEKMPDANASELHVFIIASFEESEGVAWALDVANAIRHIVGQYHPQLLVRIQGIHLLPEGKHQFDAEIAEVLTRLNDTIEQGEERPYSFVWLVTPVNPDNKRLSEEERRTFCATMLLIHIATDLAKWLWRPDTPFGVVTPTEANIVGSASLVHLKFPAEHIIATGSADVARQIANALLEPDIEAWDPKQSSKKFATTAPFDLNQLKAELLKADDGSSLLEQIQIYQRDPKDPNKRYPIIACEEVPITRYPALLVMFDAYYRRYYLSYFLEQVDKNAEKQRRRIMRMLEERVDELVENHRLPNRAMAFVNALFQHVRTLREAFATTIGAQPHEAPQTIPHLNELRTAIANLPSPYALALRLALIALLIWAPLAALLNLLPRLLGSPLSILTAQPFNTIIALVLVAFIATVYGYLRYDSALAAVYEALAKAIAGMEEIYRTSIITLAHQRIGELIMMLYRRLADEDTLKREFPEFEGMNEPRMLKQFENVLRQLNNAIKAPPEPQLNAFAISALQYADEHIQFPYKEGKFQIDEEVRIFLERGGYKGWRELNASELAKRLQQYAREGYSYIHRIHLHQWMQKHIGDENLNRLRQRLNEWLKPFVRMRENLPPPHIIAIVHPEAGEQFVQWLLGTQVKSKCIPDLKHHHWAILLSITDAVECTKLAAWDIWSSRSNGKHAHTTRI